MLRRLLEIVIGPLLIGILAPPACAQKAEVIGGNVVWVDAHGFHHQKTKSRADLEAVVAADGTLIVFVRRTEPDTADGEITASEVWMVGTAEGSEPQRLYARQSADGAWGRVLGSLQVSPDSKSVYFMSDYSATAGALWRLDLGSRRASLLLTGAAEYGIIRSGDRRGQLIVQRRSVCGQSPEETNCYPYFLFTAEGRLLQQVGDDGADLDALLREYGGTSNP